MKSNYYFTFGQKYSYEPHPMYPGAHPNIWVRVRADNYKQARDYAVDNLFGPYFAFMYNESDWKPEFFPGGELACIEI